MAPPLPGALKNKQSRSDFFFVYIAYTLRYLYLLLLIPFYGRVLGVEGYAVVLAAMSLMTIVWRFVDWGFSTAGMRSIATAQSNKYADLFAENFVGRLILSALALIGGGLAVFLSPVLSNNPIAGCAAVLLGAISAFNLGWYYTGSGRPRYAVKLEVLGFAISLVLIFSLVRNQDDTSLVLISLLVSGFIALLVAHWWIRNEIKHAQYSVTSGLKLIRNSSTIFLYNGSSTLLVASSTYLLSILSTASEVGYFGAAERLVAIGLSVMGPAGQIFVPRITALFLHDYDAAYDLVKKALLLLLGISVLGLICSWVIGDFAVELIFGKGFEDSVDILKWLSFLFPLSAISLILSSYVLLPQHKEKLLARIVLYSAAISLVMAIPLGYYYGGMGMVVARLFGESIVCVSLIYTCWKLGFLTKILTLKS